MIKQPTIALTMGDPKGIGPEIICKALGSFLDKAGFIVFGHKPFFNLIPEFKSIQDKVKFVEVSLEDYLKGGAAKGLSDEVSGKLSLLAVQAAIEDIKTGKADAY